MYKILLFIFVISLFFYSGCSQQEHIYRPTVPDFIIEKSQKDPKIDATNYEKIDDFTEIPSLNIIVSCTEELDKLNEKYFINQSIENVLTNQLTAHRFEIDPSSQTTLYVHVLWAGIPERLDERKIRTAKVRIGAWLVLRENEPHVFQSVFDGSIMIGMKKPNESTYAGACQKAASQIVRTLKIIGDSNFIRSMDVKWITPDRTKIVAVGISEYKDRDISTEDVEFSATDAQAVTSFAISAGVPREMVTKLTNEEATRSSILDAVTDLKSWCDESDKVAIFYYSGHGGVWQNSGNEYEGVLVPYDGIRDTNDTFGMTSIKKNFLIETLSASEGQGVVILDSCFSGNSNDSRGITPKGAKGLYRTANPFKKKQDQENKIWYISSTSSEHISSEYKEKRRGLFTYYFLKALGGNSREIDTNRDDIISLEEVCVWTQKNVKRTATQKFDNTQIPEFYVGKDDLQLTKIK